MKIPTKGLVLGVIIFALLMVGLGIILWRAWDNDYVPTEDPSPESSTTTTVPVVIPESSDSFSENPVTNGDSNNVPTETFPQPAQSPSSPPLEQPPTTTPPMPPAPPEIDPQPHPQPEDNSIAGTVNDVVEDTVREVSELIG